MSLNTVLSAATSGLMAAQTGLRVVSDNVANINTPGYTRKVVSQENRISAGMGIGVDVTEVKRVADRFLQAASLRATSDAASASAIADALDNAQSLFGDPSAPTSFFAQLNNVFSAFSAAADDPSSALRRSSAVSAMENFLGEASRIGASLANLGKTTDSRIAANVDRVNDLLEQIDSLNTDIMSVKMTGGDATGSENIQSKLVDELSGLMNVKVSPRDMGGVDVRTTEGVVLAGAVLAKLTYHRSDSGNSYITSSTVGVPNSESRFTLTGGEIHGLMTLRNVELGGISDQLGEMVSRAAEQINIAANASSSVPAPARLTGRNTGFGADMESAAAGFTGISNVAITDENGVVQRHVQIDFDNHTMTIDGGAVVGFTDATFDADLDGALAGFGTASFAAGRLTIEATTPDHGVALAEDAANPSNKAGRGFGSFFGMNDLIRSDGLASYETGLTGTSNHGFGAGEQIIFRLTDANNQLIRDATITIPAGGTMDDLLAELNANGTGLGVQGSFSLNQYGELSFTPKQAGVTLSVTSDATQRGPGGPTMSQFFGLGAAERGNRGSRFFVDPAIVSDPSKLPFAQLDLNATPGQAGLVIGDGRGALALAKAGDAPGHFSATGGMGATTGSLSAFFSEVSGSIARKADTASSRQQSADSVKLEADARRQSVEGVNLDEELISMTTYQQAYNASSRLIQAAKEMMDQLINLV
ncbi:flagellar hook-associated protein FlgK [Caulobacter segnis]|uniref:flagellar hook-associated protein FlgK n=1 Tax=Caulobacter segnis TaxID=88688 RepID=UPI00240F7342|nr:flagellar hook-associated protein FlgK [Caulobacter segnis]MDG2520874.1 flagellar hook-associated protein FlgK [Caulobacter segnis]